MMRHKNSLSVCIVIESVDFAPDSMFENTDEHGNILWRTDSVTGDKVMADNGMKSGTLDGEHVKKDLPLANHDPFAMPFENQTVSGSVYVIFDVSMTGGNVTKTDAQAGEVFKRLSLSHHQKMEGTVLVDGGRTKVEDGNFDLKWSPNRMAIVRFANVTKARDSLEHDDYLDAFKKYKALGGKATVFIVEGAKLKNAVNLIKAVVSPIGTPRGGAKKSPR